MVFEISSLVLRWRTLSLGLERFKNNNAEKSPLWAPFSLNAVPFAPSWSGISLMGIKPLMTMSPAKRARVMPGVRRVVVSSTEHMKPLACHVKQKKCGTFRNMFAKLRHVSMFTGRGTQTKGRKQVTASWEFFSHFPAANIFADQSHHRISAPRRFARASSALRDVGANAPRI